MWTVVIDHGTYCNYLEVHSEWAANLICDDYRFKAKLRGDTKTRFYVIPTVVEVVK